MLIQTKQFSLFCVLPVNYKEMYILKFILTFRLAMDARLHQKTELRAEKPTLSESSKNIAIDTKILTELNIRFQYTDNNLNMKL